MPRPSNQVDSNNALRMVDPPAGILDAATTPHLDCSELRKKAIEGVHPDSANEAPSLQRGPLQRESLQ
jgi:hypothetical protein